MIFQELNGTKSVRCDDCGTRIDFCGFMPDMRTPEGHFIDDERQYCDDCGEKLHLGQEFRICNVCGLPMTEGMTDLDNFYTHEECFEQAMDNEFTAGWRETEDDGCDGYYEWYDPRENEWCGTGIFYTQWY